MRVGAGTAEKPNRSGEIARVDQPRRLFDLVPRVLEPELGRLMHRLERQFVAMHPLAPLVAGALENRGELVPLCGHGVSVSLRAGG